MRRLIRLAFSFVSFSVLVGCAGRTSPVSVPPTVPQQCEDSSKVPLTHDLLRLLTSGQVQKVQLYAALPFSLQRWRPPAPPLGRTVSATTASPETLMVDCLKAGTVMATRSYGRANDVLYVSFGAGSPDIPFDNAPRSTQSYFGDWYWLRHDYLDAGVNDSGPQFDVVDDSYLLIDKPTAATPLSPPKVLPGRPL